MQVTMIQTAAALSAIVNGGNYYTPTIVAGKMENGKFVKAEEKASVRKVVSEGTGATIREMMYATREPQRTSGTDPAGYYVGGKTGTAQVIKNGEYSFDEFVGTYMGFGGTEGEMPEYVIMVRVWEEGKQAAGERHAALVFNAVKSVVQDYLRIRPKGQ